MKKVLITGAAKGIGKELVKVFHKNNYEVIFTYLNSIEEALKLEKQLGVKAIRCDITNEEDIKKLLELEHIDILINNAAYTQDNYYYEKTKDEFMKVLEVNVVGTFLMIKYLSNIMDKGLIINISSTDGIDTYNEVSMDYCASKAAINSLTQTYSLAINSKVIAVAPAWVNTEIVKDMYPLFLEEELRRTNQTRLLQPSEVAERIFEISKSDIKTGSIIRIGVEDNV